MVNLSNKIFSIKAAIIICGVIVCGCSNNVQEVRDLGIRKAGKEEAKDITAYMSEGGKQKAKLTSPYMQHLTQDTAKMVFPKSLHVEFYDSTGKVESRLFAKFAINYENLRKVLLQDSVLVYNMTGDTMRTNELWWDQNKQMFYTDKNVHTKQQGNDIYSIGMTSDQAFKNIHFFQISRSILLVADSTMPAK